VKALTLTQPWAALVALGEKRFETRSWRTDYRGPLAIHAAKGYPAECRELVEETVFYEALLRGFRLERGFGLPSHLEVQRGKVLATCQLTGCHLIGRTVGGAITLDGVPPRAFSLEEEEFGDYEPGRYAWRLEDVRLLATPVPARGALGLWEWVA
jgi:hypothetical protein